MASILTSELGFIFALANIFLIFCFLRSKQKNAFLVLNFISIILFLTPLFSNISSLQFWETQFQKEFQASLPEGLFKSSTLFTGFNYKTIQPTSYVFSQKDNLDLDFYPAENCQNCPFVVVIHGGGWDSGNKAQLPQLNSFLAHNGLSVAAVSYRLAPHSKWPTQKQDVLSAIEYLKANAAKLQINPQKYMVLGRSAGAQIAGMIAYTSTDPGLKGYIDFYGPTDMEFGYEVADEVDLIQSRSLLENFLGKPFLQNIKSYREASPLNFISKSSVPTLIFHGKMDSLSWYKHAERLERRLKQENVPVFAVLFPYSTHGFDYFLNGPSGQVSTRALLAFAQKFLIP